MSSEYDYWTVEAMSKFGGSFVKALAELARRADPMNLDKIKLMWHHYWAEYYEVGQRMRFEACPEGLCDGSKEIPCDETDIDGNVEIGVGMQKCLCTV